MLPGRILKRFYFYMKKTKITWNVAVVSLLLKKKCAQKVYYGWVWSSGGKSLRCVFPFSLSATMLWGWLKLVRPQVVERSEKRSKPKTNWGRPVSLHSREILAWNASLAEPYKKRRRKKMKKKRTFRVSLQFHFLFSPSLQTLSVTARAFLTYAKIRAILQSNWRVWHALISCTY